MQSPDSPQHLVNQLVVLQSCRHRTFVRLHPNGWIDTLQQGTSTWAQWILHYDAKDKAFSFYSKAHLKCLEVEAPVPEEAQPPHPLEKEHQDVGSAKGKGRKKVSFANQESYGSQKMAFESTSQATDSLYTKLKYGATTTSQFWIYSSSNGKWIIQASFHPRSLFLAAYSQQYTPPFLSPTPHEWDLFPLPIPRLDSLSSSEGPLQGADLSQYTKLRMVSTLSTSQEKLLHLISEMHTTGGKMQPLKSEQCETLVQVLRLLIQSLKLAEDQYHHEEVLNCLDSIAMSQHHNYNALSITSSPSLSPLPSPPKHKKSKTLAPDFIDLS